MTDPAQTRTALGRLRPDLLPAFEAALPGAHAAILARFWGALAREPLPGVTARRRAGDRLTVTLADGRQVSGSAAAAEPYAEAPAGLVLRLAGTEHRDAAGLLRALALPGAVDRLAAELTGSAANLALARAARPAPHGGPPLLPGLAADPVGALATVEQYVVDGHPLHPCCRTRTGMSAAEVLAYAPEHRPVLDVPLYRVPADRWQGTAPPLLPVHPWQRDHVLPAHPWLRPTGRSRRMRPLMSLRTLAPVGGGDHVKTAVDVQMTSAVRTVSPAAVHNGPRLSVLLADLAAGLPLTVLAEPAAGAALVDGAPSRSLAYLCRRAPRLAAGEVAVPLAALAAPSPVDGRPVLAELVAGYGGDPVGWLDDLSRALLAPLLTLLRRGVACEAHGQNTLLVLRAGRPARLLYRDLGGVRVSPARLRAHGVVPPDLHGDLPADDPALLRVKLAAALLGGVFAEQVRLLADGYGTAPATLWAVVRRRLHAVGTPDAAALLDAPVPVKATTAMRLADDPLHDRWAELDRAWAEQP